MQTTATTATTATDVVLSLRLDADRRIVRASDSTAAVTGQTAESLVGQSFDRLVAADMPRVAVDELWARAERTLVQRVAMRMERADGARFWTVLGVCPVHQDGVLVQYIVSVLVPELPAAAVIVLPDAELVTV